MAQNQKVKVKALKDVDSPSRALVLNNFVKVFPLLAVLGWVIGGLVGVSAAAVVSLGAAAFATAVAGTVAGTSVNLLYGMGRKTAGLRDELAAPLSVARFHKMSGNFEDALIAVDTILARDPGFAEALLLRAQILLDGYDDRGGAKECLLRLFRVLPDKNDCTRRWGQASYRQIVQQEKERQYDVSGGHE